MEANILEESDGVRIVIKDENQDFGSPDLDYDKKSVFWMGGVLDCFSTVLSLFGRGDFKDEDGMKPILICIYVSYDFPRPVLLNAKAGTHSRSMRHAALQGRSLIDF